MTKIYLIRHAEAEGNLYRRAQGHFNANITALGRRQIGALARRFRDEEIDALWSSDLNRTRSTAAAILKYHPELTLNLSPMLREIDVGLWEDMPWGGIERQFPEELWFFNHDPARWHVDGGEPYTHVQTRMRAAVLDLADRYLGRTVAVVSHGLAIRALACDILGIPSAEIDRLPYGDNTSVTTLLADGGTLRIEDYGDASHLADAGLSTFDRQAWRRQQPGSRVYTRFEPLDPATEGDLYLRCYAATWQASHGSLTGYVPAVYLSSARDHAARDPRCLVKLFQGDDFAGVVELDPDRGREDGAGWISLLYIEPDKRGLRLGMQLVGHAVSYFRREGRASLRLNTAFDNRNAVDFYLHNGFKSVGTVRGSVGRLHLMEMDIAPRVLTPADI